MNIDRPMVSLFFEIKRNMPFEQRDDMKISAPDVGERLVSIYRHSNNEALRQLIENFMSRAGTDWSKQLSPSKKPKMMFYRGVFAE